MSDAELFSLWEEEVRARERGGEERKWVRAD
jgi:hypothetical protein